MNILIKLMSIVSLVIAPYIAGIGSTGGDKAACCKEKMEACISKATKCDMSKCVNMGKEECAAYCDSMGCSVEEKEMCLKHAGMKTDGNAETSSCFQGCDHGCKTKEECVKSCGEECAKMHKE
jgi:hypothetical protein